MRTAHQHRDHHVRFGGLDFLDGRAELVDVQREEVGADHGRPRFCRVLLDPVGRDLTVVVVSRHDVDLLAPALGNVGHQLVDVLRRCLAGTERVAVAHAAFVLRVVEIERIEALHHRPDDFTRGRSDAAEQCGHFILERHLLRVLGIELHVRLRVHGDYPYLFAEQTAGAVDFLDCQLHGVFHRLAQNVQAARKIMQAADDDVVGAFRKTGQRCGCCNGGCAAQCFQSLPAGDRHFGAPVLCDG